MSTGTRGRQEAVAVLRVPVVLRFLMGKVMVGVGSWLLQIAIIDALYEASGSVLAIGVWFAVRMLPMILLAPIGGLLVDRWPKRVTLACSTLLMGLVMLLYLGSLNAYLILVVTLLLGTLQVLYQPAEYSIIPCLVKPENLLGLNALMSGLNSALLVFGPAAGAVILSRLGLRWTVALDACAFLAGTALFATLSVKEPPRLAEKPRRRSLVANLRFIPQALKDAPTVVPVIATCLLLILGAGMLQVSLYPYAVSVLGQSPGGYGLLLSAVGVGGLVGAAVAASLRRRKGLTPVLFAAGALISGIAITCTFGALALPVGLVLMAVHGAGGAVYEASRDTLVQTRSPVSGRGRVYSVMAALLTTANLCGTLVWGVVAEKAGVLSTFLYGGIIVIAAGGYGMWTLARPSLRGRALPDGPGLPPE